MLTAKDLTKGERLLLERRRAEETKPEAAARHGVSFYRYDRWERDIDNEAPRVAVGVLEFREVSLIRGQRAGASVRDFAELVGVSPWWLTQIETGQVSDERIRSFWAEFDAKPSRKSPGKARAR